MAAIRVRVLGRVQGVGYRAWTETEAKARGLEGWVRNRNDGSVEAVLVGTESQLDQMVAAMRQGPPAARVSDIKVEPDPAPVGIGFRMLPTS